MSASVSKRWSEVGVGTCLILTVLACGCTSSAKVKPFVVGGGDASKPVEGVVFYLPKSILVADITYSVYEQADATAKSQTRTSDANDGSVSKATVAAQCIVLVERAIELTIDTIPDSRMAFLLDPRSLESGLKDTEITLELTEEGLLKSANMVTTDKAGEVAANLTNTVFNLAKLAAVTIKGRTTAGLRKVQDVTVSRRIDPATLTCKPDGGAFVAVYSDKDAAAKSLPGLEIPDVQIELRCAIDIAAASQQTASGLLAEEEKAREIRGIPYRVPATVDINVTVDGAPVYAGSHAFAQAAGVGLLPMESGAFSSTTSGLVLSETTGALTKYSSKQSASAAAATGTAKEVSSISAEGAKEMLTYGLDAELERAQKKQELAEAESDLELADLQAQIDLLTKEKELIEAQLALDEAKQEKDEAGEE